MKKISLEESIKSSREASIARDEDMQSRINNTQVVLFFTCLVVITIFIKVFFFSNINYLPDNCTIRGQEIATKCDLNS